MLDLIIFDMDGVIVDTEYFGFEHLKNFIDEIKTRQSPISHQEYSAIIGRSYDDLYLAIKTLSQTDLSVNDIGKMLSEYVQKHIKEIDYISIFRKDIIEIIHFAKQQNIKLAIASSSSRQQIENILILCKIRPHFDFIISGKELPQSKPNPAIYQKVLAHFSIPANKAVTIEDSSHGIQAAKKAGITVIAYEETRIAIDQTLADYKGKNMLEILDIIKRLHFKNRTKNEI
ncbi:HAD superfamily hydrolase (TIGR01509 family)/HAD superfamily hydrolase (TIGR01549 family) [Bisgaardia hudsonensis]|uniref:phosphoglycolate phosphatase n=1 Tax=Bisgaardia hudsonensis TaxID=109472 RepID=A0A4R2N1G9_9PAST|nr:HAD family phosphatase [Bisgaardia hudsonensis]QLB13021.1 hypothetical protein A6A11_05060 [Bisgaardia hudsonensis]TCP13415.1 HAD superfamily hydrolase (TIGR01509 family)/HAD superfamily hydrolase (TIGR01549 family) [Bisgaardia hudsonensis]